MHLLRIDAFRHNPDDVEPIRRCTKYRDIVTGRNLSDGREKGRHITSVFGRGMHIRHNGKLVYFVGILDPSSDVF
jgi:hypothetical protein